MSPRIGARGRRLAVVLTVVGLTALGSRGAAQIVNTHRGFREEDLGWYGVIGLALDLRTGNTRYVDAEIDGKVQFQSARHRVRALLLTDYRTSKGEKTAESILAHVRHNYRLHPSLSSIAFVQWGRDPFRRIAWRNSLGVGARVDLFRDHGWPVALGASVMGEREGLEVQIGFVDSTTSEEVRTRYRLSTFVTVYSTKIEHAKIDVWGIFEPLINDLSVARSSGSARAAVDVSSGMAVVATYTITHDSDPPSDVREVDSRLRIGVTLRF